MPDTSALLLVERLPHALFEDMDTVREFVETHTRLDYDTVQIVWPLHVEDPADIPPRLREGEAKAVEQGDG